MKTYNFSMPWPPSVNAWKTPFKGRMILSKRGRDYRKAVIAELVSGHIEGEMIDSRLSVQLVLNPPTLRKYDIDNFCKSLFDGLTTGGFWVDDELIDKLTVRKGEKVKGGRVDVMVSCYE